MQRSYLPAATYDGTGRRPVPWKMVAQAKRLMRSPHNLDLYGAAHAIGVRPRDLDHELWRNIGDEGWAE